MLFLGGPFHQREYGRPSQKTVLTVGPFAYVLGGDLIIEPIKTPSRKDSATVCHITVDLGGGGLIRCTLAGAASSTDWEARGGSLNPRAVYCVFILFFSHLALFLISDS